MKNIVSKKVKKLLAKNKHEKIYPIAFCFFSFVTWLIFNLNPEQYKNFQEFWETKITNHINAENIFNDINQQIENNNINLDKYLNLADNLKLNKTLTIIFINYLQAIIIYASINSFKCFIEKDFKLETYNDSVTKFSFYLNKMSVVNNHIKEIFPYNYACIIDFAKNIKKEVFEK